MGLYKNLDSHNGGTHVIPELQRQSQACYKLKNCLGCNVTSQSKLQREKRYAVFSAHKVAHNCLWLQSQMQLTQQVIIHTNQWMKYVGYICGSQRSTIHAFHLTSRESLPLTKPGAHQFSKASCLQSFRNPHSLTTPVLGLQAYTTKPSFYVGNRSHIQVLMIA